MHDPADIEVLVVGAGPTGLVLATELWRRGISCRLIDSLTQPADRSRALAVHARTLELFDMMGVIDDFLNIGWRSSAFTVFHHKTPIVRMTFDELESRYPYLLSLPQFDTERILADHLRTVGGTIERGLTLRSVAQSKDRATAQIEHLDGTQETVTCRFLVACDGAHSSVRRLLNLPFKGMPYWEQYVLADINFESSLDPHDHYLFSGEHGVAGFHAFSSDSARIFADIGRIPRTSENEDKMLVDKAQFPEPSMEQLQSFLDERGPGSVRLTKLNWVSMHRIHRRQVHSYRSDRVFLAGDAAHLHSPTGGQGMNLGIQDAYNLGWKLAFVLRGMAGDRLLDSYNMERHLVGKQVTLMSDFFTRINEVRSPVLQLMRNSIGPVLSRRDDVRYHYRRAVSGIGTNYRFSPAVSEDIRGEASMRVPRRGDRAPDCTFIKTATNQPIRLFELLHDTKFQVLLFAGPAANADLLHAFTQLTAAYNGWIRAHIIVPSKIDDTDDNQLLDSDLKVHDRFGAQPSALYLLRPDGYVAFASRPANLPALSAYLATQNQL